MIRRITSSCGSRPKKNIKSCNDAENISIRNACDVEGSDHGRYHPKNIEYCPVEDDLEYDDMAPDVGEFKDIEILNSEDITATSIECSYEDGMTGQDEYAAEVALDVLRSGDEDDVASAVSYAVNLVNNANAEAEYEDEDFYMEEADYDTVFRYVQKKYGKGVEGCDSVTAAEEYPHGLNVKEVCDAAVAAIEQFYPYSVEYHIKGNKIIFNVEYNYNEDDYDYLGNQLDSMYSTYADELDMFGEDESSAGAGLADDICTELGLVPDSQINSSTEIEGAEPITAEDDKDYFVELTLAIDNAIEEKGYTSVCRILDDYLEVQLFEEFEEEFDNAIYTYLTDLDDIKPNIEDVAEDAETIADKVVNEYKSTIGSINGFTEIESKQVLDSDGYWTDYTMYQDDEDGTYIFMFGDKDIYEPDRDWADWECETEEEAYEWFESYKGPGDEE